MTAWNRWASTGKFGYTSASLRALRRTAGGRNEKADFGGVKIILHKYSLAPRQHLSAPRIFGFKSAGTTLGCGELSRESAMPRIVEEPAPKRPTYFWWLLANVLALCFAVISWVVCLLVFGNPEVPRNYEILRKLGRLPVLKRYTALDAPNGNVLDPKGLYSKFYGSTGEPLKKLNAQLMRNYLTNFSSQPTEKDKNKPLTELPLTYVEGDYQVEKTRVLGKSDFLPAGFAVRARALVKPDDFTKPAPYPVVVEYLFPTKNSAVAGEFHAGDILSVKKSPNCAAIVHVERIAEGDESVVGLTVIPIAYGPYHVGDAITFNLEPPTEVRPAAGFPVFKPNQ